MHPILKTLLISTLMFVLREVIIVDPCAAIYPIIPGLGLCIPHGLA